MVESCQTLLIIAQCIKLKEKRVGMFNDRVDAAEQLVAKLEQFKDVPNTIVLAVPRGGLPIGNIIAKQLNVPLDIILTKKIGAPFNPEFAIGAVTPDSYFINVQYDNPTYAEYIKREVPRIQELLKKRAQTYRGSGKASVPLTGKTVIIVDDGVATGRTLLAAVQAIKKQKPRRIVIATPVIPPDAKELLEQQADEVISVITPSYLGAIGEFYQDFSQVSDEEAMQILQSFGSAT